jgi:hypothetical protein
VAEKKHLNNSFITINLYVIKPTILLGDKMTCANILLTVAAAVIFIFAVWPGVSDPVVVKWVVGIASLVILVAAWTMVECKFCSKKKKK